MADKKIFFTLAATLRAIDENRVDDCDLRSGLFCLDCTKEHAREPWKPYGSFDPEQTNELSQVFGSGRGDAVGAVHQRVIAALERAKSEGRALYLDDDTDWHDAGRLNAFLEKHGLGRPIPPDEVFLGHDLELWLERIGHKVTVIC
jgi:hypothetical protein